MTANMCQQNMCPQPACYSTKPDAGMTSNPDGGAGGGSCNDLKACCDMVTEPNAKNGCNASVATGDAQQCSQVLSAYKQSGLCH